METNKPLISVIIPVYKVEEYLPACIDSVLAQTYENLEIILVDDGSPDNCGKICDEYAEKDSRIKVIHKENGGLSSARNAGLREMSGDYVGFVDSDDSIEPEMYETLYNAVAQNGADISICKFRRCKNQLGDGPRSAEDIGPTLIFERNEALKYLLLSKYYGGHVCNKLFKREVLDGVFLDETTLFIEDLEFTTRVFLRTSKVCFTPVALYNYLTRDSSLLSSPFSPKHYTAHESSLKIIETLKKHGVYDELAPYGDIAVLSANMILMRKLYVAKQYRKEYCPLVKKNIRAHLNKKTFSLLKGHTQIRVALMAISCNLYFLALKFHL